ncbi:MAG: DNA-directed RNA polymerase subunit beta' [Phycisphaerae bacterium]|nr:DNA-directed RNA polymerase subunit beta' [Phycisphaerae bacterium]
MAESVYDRINDFTGVRISLASPNDIRSWSFGEVKKPETINYRTYRAEKDGLFCERIFGPERDWECFCGKYRGIKYKGMICERCGVKVTHSRVRRKRMGHINLAAPVVHIWFFKAMPSRLGTLLDMKTSDLEKVVYFQDYVVVDPGQSKLEPKQLLTEEEYRRAVEEYGDSGFRAMMGAEAVRELLAQIDVESLSVELHDGIKKTNSKQKIKDLSKRLKLVEAIRESCNQPEWMVLQVIPVIPPDLRPLVLLDSGNFATSDLNDLYRRIINRNNRLKKLIDLNAPEVIIRNEKRMLQQAVDALFDNGRCRRPVLGSSNRPLKSLTDMIKGKQGRFRENLLGKRVDYSARSVVVVGPELKLHQCGLPKKIALELYQPFIIRKLRERGLADTIKSAKKMLERRDQPIWDILERVIYQHPVLLNRAPTLHRMGIQAFEPVLVEGNAIKIHPLVCKGFNADFDGDQMAVHLPLSIEAQAETHVLMMSTHNIFGPANGQPMMTPSQDIVMGIYYLTSNHASEPGEREPGKERAFGGMREALMAHYLHQIGMHTPIKVRIDRAQVVQGKKESPTPTPKNGVIVTTIGRCIFNDILPEKMPFYNYPLGKDTSRVIADCFARLGRAATVELLDNVKELGFKQSTLAGLSFGVTDLRIPESKPKILDAAQKIVDRVEQNYSNGVITPMERHNQLIDIWVHAREKITAEMMKSLASDWRLPDGRETKTGDEKGKPYLNPIHLMTDSGARGSVDQIRQLAGMRALMAKPSGEIIEAPIKANFREGLTVLEYFSSTHGARKGLADTALKTADSGYLTRKLADVAQNVITNEHDCGTVEGVTKSTIYKGEEVDIKLSELIIGRVARDTIRDPRTDEIIVRENELISRRIAQRLEDKLEDGGLGIESIRVRSPLTCESPRGICALCYGADLSAGKLVEEGMAVGIIGAQSIGEPGTQLTMRTFHTGGVASRSVVENQITNVQAGTLTYINLNAAEMADIEADRTIFRVLKRNGEIAIRDAKGRELERYKVPYGAAVLVGDGAEIPARTVIVDWDPHFTPMLAEATGFVRFQDIVDGETVRFEQEGRAESKRVVIEHKGDKHPRVIIEDKEGKILDFHHLPAKARIEVKEGDPVQAGTLLARQPREISGTQDITGGLPRVTEIFEARKPKEPAVMAEISGSVELATDKRRGKMTITIRSESGMEKEHHVPQDKQLLVHAGDYVNAGAQLTEGPLIPHDILRISGEEDLHRYLLKEVQAVYRQQNVTINDKHIEVILAQMLRKVRIDNEGDSAFTPYEVVDKFRFRSENQRLSRGVKIVDPGDTEYEVGAVVPRDEFANKNDAVEATGGTPAKGRRPRPATGKTLLLGITKASLQSESFISAASFQETTKVLTQASLAGQEDVLVGLKENVILGRLIPAGTGFNRYQGVTIKYLAEPLPEPPVVVEQPADILVGVAPESLPSETPTEESSAPVGGPFGGQPG